MMQKRAAASTQFFQNGSLPDLVAIDTPNPNLRYLAGKDEEWVKSKNGMTDAEFHDMMMKDVSN
jgi:hypothetical protein